MIETLLNRFEPKKFLLIMVSIILVISYVFFAKVLKPSMQKTDSLREELTQLELEVESNANINQTLAIAKQQLEIIQQTFAKESQQPQPEEVEKKLVQFLQNQSENIQFELVNFNRIQSNRLGQIDVYGYHVELLTSYFELYYLLEGLEKKLPKIRTESLDIRPSTQISGYEVTVKLRLAHYQLPREEVDFE